MKSVEDAAKILSTKLREKFGHQQRVGVGRDGLIVYTDSKRVTKGILALIGETFEGHYVRVVTTGPMRMCDGHKGPLP